ncbi:alpha/beta hydrolase family protein [Ferrimonas balearica]|uniref:alpha/beta hydrolase family protein n=1 Tax=Ferrimonas balearica TaxID=44012 RepID=UPI001C98FE6A|nr:S9 family peptidase [Ferrimonas balearica]MBY5921857.1 S9 family peptidase [Ferrimonas balearica]MBY5994803.1 S9 family peptidase [Ferrimonas balearica]
MKPWISAFLLLFSVATWAKPADITAFSRADQYTEVKISPDGAHLAIKMPIDGKQVLAILDAKTKETRHIARFSGEKQVGAFDWGNDERLIVQLDYFRGLLERPVTAGEWFAFNLDGKRTRNIFGYRAGGPETGTRIRNGQSIKGYGEIVDLLRDDDDEILISSTPFDQVADASPFLYRLNIYNGRTRKVTRSPVPEATFLIDHQGRARFVSGISEKGVSQIYYRNDEDSDWELLRENAKADLDLRPLAFAGDNEVYVRASADADLTGVYKLNMTNGESQLLFRDKVADPSHFWLSADGRHLYALEVEADYPEYVFIDKARPETQMLKDLLAAFPGKQVRIVSQTQDGSKSVVLAFSDRDPGGFYLYDDKAKALSKLVSRRPWVDPSQSAEMKPIEFTARDGQLIRGFLTLPPGQEVKNLPLVVNPHGGPYQARDWWEYRSETQLLASRGMAVLQVNFRGSPGFGKAFQQAGYRQWGGTIQHDIIDGTRYLIEQGIVDKERICIFGASFGGYSAMQSAILEPDLFACAIGFMGVYDLPLMFEEGDVPDSQYGENYLQRVLGEDMAQLKAFSPVYQVEKLKAPVLLIHGDKDERAPIEHAERLKAALEARKHPVQYVAMDKEGHVFYNEQNRAEIYETLLGFLETHLKL